MSCVAKVGPRSFLIETESGKLYRRNRKFILQDPSQVPVLSEIADSSATNQTSADVGPPAKSLDARADSSLKQTQTLLQTCESSQPKLTTAEEINPVTTADHYSKRENQFAPSRLNDLMS